MLVIEADVVTFDDDRRVLAGGRVLVGDDGRIAGIADRDARLPERFAAARTVIFDGFVYPGLIDCHNHIPYNTIGLWRIPGRADPFADHNEWTEPDAYTREVTGPQRLLGWAAGPQLLAYVETKALVGGTTTIQGSGRFRARSGILARNLDSERFGGDSDKYRVDTIVKRDAAAFDEIREAMKRGEGYIYAVRILPVARRQVG